MCNSSDLHIRYLHYDADEALFGYGITKSFVSELADFGFRVLDAHECNGGWDVKVEVERYNLFHNIVNRVPYLSVLPDDFKFGTNHAV